MKRTPVGRKGNFISNIMWRNILGQAFYQFLVIWYLQTEGKWLFGIKGDNSDLVLNTLIFNCFVFCQVISKPSALMQSLCCICILFELLALTCELNFYFCCAGIQWGELERDGEDKRIWRHFKQQRVHRGPWQHCHLPVHHNTVPWRFRKHRTSHIEPVDRMHLRRFYRHAYCCYCQDDPSWFVIGNLELIWAGNWSWAGLVWSWQWSFVHRH